MDLAAFLLLAVLMRQVSATETVTGLYGETIVVPCNGGASPPEDLMFIKWKYERKDGTPGDLLIKQARVEEATIQATDDYADRVDIDDNYSLLIREATLEDQRSFTCMVVSDNDLMEYSTTVTVNKKPSSVEILDKPEALQKDKAQMVGTCVVSEAHPAAIITWKRNGEPLVADGKAVVITPSMKLDPATGLSTSSSTLQYVATKEDIGAVFACMSQHVLGNQETELKPFPIHYPSEKVTLQVMNKGPILEGDDVTLKCQADGNPAPDAFYFNIKGEQELVEDSDTFTLTAVTREATGEYKCSLADNEKLEAAQSIVVSYLDLNLNPTGKIVEIAGDSLPLKVDIKASDDAKVSWTKDGNAATQPEFSKLTYSDAGAYVCEVSMGTLSRRQSFELVVEGKPVITSLTKELSEDGKYKVLTCEADGVPEPKFEWSINGTHAQSTYINAKATHKISVIPKVNQTVTCSVTNKLGEHFMTINVTSVFEERSPEGRGAEEESGDQAKLIGGVIAGLLIAALVVGLIYWLYIKNSRQGSWKTGEKEMGTPEESKKLEENNHTV